MAQALRDVAAHVPARRAMAIQHRIARARRPPRARVETATRGVLPHAHLRATGYERHRLHSPRRTGPAPADSSVPGRYGWNGGYGTFWFNDPSRSLIAIAMSQTTDILFNGTTTEFAKLAVNS